jgi:hypothetical protein
MTIEQRLAALENDRAIRDLKMRYLRAADAKDPETMRRCFTKDARIAFEGFPEFSERDPFIEVYREFGCAKGVFDIHQGGTGVIEMTSETEAQGWWPLYFHNINLAERTLTQLGVEYEDRYVLQAGQWLIAESRSYRKSCLIQAVDAQGAVMTVAMGDAPGAFGERGDAAEID